MDRRVQDEICELEEVVASLIHYDYNADVVAELRIEIERLKELDRQSN